MDSNLLIKLLGDGSQMQGVFAANESFIRQWAARQQAIFKGMLVGPTGPFAGMDPSKLGFGKLTSEINTAAGAWKMYGQVTRTVLDPMTQTTHQITENVSAMRGSVPIILESINGWNRADDAMRNIYQRQSQLSGNLQREITSVQQMRAANLSAAQGQLAQAQAIESQLAQYMVVNGRVRWAPGATMGVPGRFAPAAGYQSLLGQQAANPLGPAQAALAAASAAAAAPAAGARIDAARLALGQFNTTAIPALGTLTSLQEAFWGLNEAAHTMAQGLPAGIAQLQQMSPQLYTALRRSGLGGPIQYGIGGPNPNAENIGAIMQAQGVKTNITQDMVRNVTRANVTWLDEATQRTKTITAEIDKNGKMLTRWGGQFSGFGQGIRQIGRDILKVGEWTIATTLVLGTMRAALGGIETITKLDKSLRQFGITANLSKDQTDAFFKSLGQVAVATATPIEELVSAADDIALATRKAGDSSDQWREKIISLTNAVGILTNLSGMDTVTATELLTSTMKQLSLTTDDLVGVLNKVTAVAGGQSGAITDIAKGLGVMAEASKQAGLSLDQSIATIQVLSQVTAKSASEVAVSFKNLVGSIDSSASIKELNKFGIAVKDEQGNLRNFLDIYAEIQSKIEQGVIPAGQVKEVVKAISGGPRRAPDAAALLANINQIYAIQSKSVNATNEALIANAKILDTISAKMVQLQNQMKLLVFDKFGNALRGSFTGMIDILKTFLAILQTIPAQAYSVGVSLALAFVGLKIFIVIGRNIAQTALYMRDKLLLTANAFGIVGENAAFAAAQTANFARAQAVAAQEAAFARAYPGLAAAGLILPTAGNNNPNQAGRPISSILPFKMPSKPLGRFGGVGLGLAATLGLSAIPIISGIAGGQSPTDALMQNAGPALMTAGMMTAMLPLPGIAQGVGVAMLGLGTIISVFGQTNQKAAKDVAQLTEQMNTQLQANKDAASAQQEATQSLNSIQAQINNLQKKPSLTSEEQSTLIDLWKQYGEQTSAATKANREFLASLKEIGGLATALKGTKSGFTEEVLKALSGENVSPEDKQKAASQAAQAILGSSNAGFAAWKEGAFPTWAGAPGKNTAFGSTAIMSLATEARKVIDGATGISMEIPAQASKQIGDLTTLATDATKLYDIFDKGTGELKVNFDYTTQNLGYIHDAINKLSEDGVTDLDKIIAKFGELADANDAVVSSMKLAEGQKAYIQAASAFNIPGFDAASASGMYKNLQVFQNLVADANQLSTTSAISNRRIVGEVVNPRQSALDLVGSTMFDKTGFIKKSIDIKDVKELYQTVYPQMYSALEKYSKGNQDVVDIAIAQWAKDAGMEITGMAQSELDAAANAEELAKVTDQLASSLSQGAANYQNYARQLQMSVVNGDINQSQMDTYLKNYKEVWDKANAIYSLGDKTIAELNQNVGVQTLIDQFTQIPQLAAAGENGLVGLIDSVMSWSSQADLSAKGTENFTYILGILSIVLESLNKSFTTDYMINVHYQTNGKSLGRALEEGEQVDTVGAAMNVINGYVSDATGGKYKSVDALLSLAKNPKNWTPSKSGSSATTPSTQTVDITKELIPQLPGVTDRIIAIAARLQHQLPGEDKANKGQIVAILEGTKVLAKSKDIGAEYLRKAIEELTQVEKDRLAMEQKADMLQRIRIGTGSFAALANVPLNSNTGVSVGGPQGPITINLNINGQLLTSAQYAQIGEAIAAQVKSTAAVN